MRVFRFSITIKVIGILSIEMVGAVYCPCSPDDPQQRLQVLVEQTQSCLVLVHSLTQMKIGFDRRLVEIDIVLARDMSSNDMNIELLAMIFVSAEHFIYVISTSGSTGAPKMVGFA